jgi:hypothetical protein
MIELYCKHCRQQPIYDARHQKASITTPLSYQFADSTPKGILSAQCQPTSREE